MNDPHRRYTAIVSANFSAAVLTGVAFDAAEFDGPASFQFSWSNIAGSNLTTPQFILQESDDNTIWDTISAKTITMTSAMATLGHTVMTMDLLHSNYYRVIATGSDVTAGTCKCTAIFKGRQRP
jgi:uncharacterized protein YjbI with pentapeptide repeats